MFHSWGTESIMNHEAVAGCTGPSRIIVRSQVILSGPVHCAGCRSLWSKPVAAERVSLSCWEANGGHTCLPWGAEMQGQHTSYCDVWYVAVAYLNPWWEYNTTIYRMHIYRIFQFIMWWLMAAGTPGESRPSNQFCQVQTCSAWS